jgi:hypothetical protein
VVSGHLFAASLATRDIAPQIMATASTPSTIGPRRPWYRLHLSTWIIAIFGLSVAIVLILPGEEGWWPWEGSLRRQQSVVHGWPWTYLWRTPSPILDPFADSGPIVPSSFAWDVRDSVKQFRLLPLVADIAACAVGIAAVVAFWVRTRRRTQRFQFSLKTLLIVVTLAAIALGWWGVQRAADQELRNRLRPSNDDPFEMVREPVPRFPLWARIAIRDERLRPLGLNGIGSEFGLHWSQRNHAEVKYFVERFPSLVVVTLESPRNDALDEFFEITGVEHLILSRVPDGFYDRLGELTHLKWVFASRIGPHALDCLAHVRSLKQATITDPAEISGADWSRFAASSDVESLLLNKVRLSALSLSRLAAMKRLRELVIMECRITDKGLAAFEGNSRIEEFGLYGTLITDEGLHYLRSMTELKSVDLRKTAVTDDGVSALLAARPELEVRYESERPDLNELAEKIATAKNGTSIMVEIHEIASPDEESKPYFAVTGWKIQDRHLTELGELTGIESLALNAHHLTDATLARVESLKRLKELDVSSSLITGHGLRHVVKLPQLRSLTLDERQIDDEGIHVLKELSAPMDVWIKHELDGEELKRLEARLKAALPGTTGIKLHFDARSNSGSPWD